MKKQDLIIILIPTLICVIAWIGFNIYHSGVTSTISPQEFSQITPISPDFNIQVIAELKQRERIEPLFLTPSSLPTKLLPTPTPIIQIPVIISTKSAQATTGGQINQ